MTLPNRASLLYGSPLNKPRNAAFLVVVLLVLIIISASSFIQEFSAVTQGGFQVFFIALAGAALLALVPLAIVWFLDRREPESRWLYAIALLWGGLIATGVALPLNNFLLTTIAGFIDLHPALQTIFGSNAGMVLGAPVAGPLVEETTKGLGVLLLFWLLRAEFDNVRDGFIYGALVGIGFNLCEAPLYVLQEFVIAGDVPLYLQLGDRFSLFGLAGHALFTGLFGLGLGLARQTTRRWLRYAAPVGGWLLGFSGHFLNNAIGLMVRLFVFITTGQPVPQASTPEVAPRMVEPFFHVWIIHSAWRLIGFFPFFLIVGVMLWQSGIWERQVIREELADEGEPVILPEEYEAVKGDRIFKTRSIPHHNRRTSAAIVQAQDELAIRKWRVKQAGQAVESDPLVASWRNELGRLRG
ncbi:PrsW family intramembrane metalloprotease [Nodosilinea sp. LEGE 07298]|uniref:PrsW family intramembrane metalloprotease n=1 Tax=Nodosilinea sp. LEGE 07298 TaxID=2777970 RepID=UPI0018811AB1|nr:PrsW family glutamic-type intramembrane protease [Nodosilinea sp. LEGE 07298]MBE9110854.1 PrsW family intramembrane metalloprotease [Nodosilinea sp. LEGE 07298]